MQTYKYTCLVKTQRAGIDIPEFCMFFAPAGEVLKWSAIERVQDSGSGFQRMAVPSRIRGIVRFLDQDTHNTIPTAVILTLRLNPGALKPSSGVGARTLTLKVSKSVKDQDKPGLVIDGQHRLMGINEFSSETPVPVVALLNPSELETAFQFLVINNKSAKVPPDHIRKLALNYSPEGLEDRLKTARLSLRKNYALVGQVDEEQDSPLRKMIRWPTPEAQDRIIVPSAVETALQYIQDQDLQPLKGDNDSLLDFFYAIWKSVKKKWKKAWIAQPKSNLLSKVGIVCLTQSLTDSLSKMYEWGEIDISDPIKVASRVDKLLEDNLKMDFWTQAWKDGSLDTSAGRQLVVEDLTKIARNRRADLLWFQDLVTIVKPAVSSVI